MEITHARLPPPTANVSGDRAGYLSRASSFVVHPADARSVSRTTNVAPVAAIWVLRAFRVGISKNKTACFRILPFAVVGPSVLCSWEFRAESHAVEICTLLPVYWWNIVYLPFFHYFSLLLFQIIAFQSILLNIGSVRKYTLRQTK